MIYFSQSLLSFYDEAIHGRRLLSTIDPDWVRPTRSVTLQPGEAVDFDGETVFNDGDAPRTVDGVPDMDAQPPMISVPNPDCMIPEDAVEITAERHKELMDGQSAGLRIVASASGHPELVTPPSPSIEQIKSMVIGKIKAERDRRKAGGVQVGGRWYLTTEQARADYLSIDALARASGLSPTAVIRQGWRPMDGGATVDMTQALAQQIIAAGAAQWFAIDTAAQTHIAAVEASPDPAAYDFSAGWPPVFQP